MNQQWTRITTITAVCIGAVLFHAAGENLPSPEKPPVLAARDLLTPELLSSKDYKVEDHVPIDHFLGKFTLTGEWGRIQIHGAELLKVRISEIPAIQELQEISKTEVFAKAAANAAARPIKSLQKVAEDPAETVKGIPAGVGRFFKRTAKAVEKGVNAVKDSDEETDSQQKDSSGEGLKEVAGYNKILREWARNLQVDPYTTNPVLEKELEGVARASFAGGLTTRVALPSAPRPISTVVRISNLVWDHPPEDVEEINHKKLVSMGVSEESSKAFLKNASFTPTTSTLFVLSLEQLKGVAGIQKAVTAATNASSEDEALFFVTSAAILAAYHRQSPVSTLSSSNLVIYAQNKKGMIVVPAGLDYLSWTEDIAEFVKRPEFNTKEKLLLLSGIPSPAAQSAFTMLGWKIQPKFQDF